MKVLIVDDSNDKVRDILAVLISAGLSEDEDIDVASSAQAAARFLKDHDYGLMILDLHLPMRLSEEPRIDGGAYLLKEIGRRKELRRPEHILGLTAHDEAKANAEPEFNKGLWSIAKASSDSSEWKEAILEKVRYLLARNAAQDAPSQVKCDVLFICALRKPELTQLKKAIGTEWEEITLPGDATAYFRTVVPSKEGQGLNVVCCSAPSMGMAASATLATKAGLKFKPRVVAMTGICAGREDEIDLGACLVASKTWDYGSGKFYGETDTDSARFAASPHQLVVDPIVQTATEAIMADQTLLDSFHSQFPGNRPDRRLSVTFAPMASGAAVQADSQFFSSIERQDRKVVGIDMEAFGVCWAARETFEPRPSFFVCKGVSDFANEEKADGIQEYCAYTSARVGMEIATKILTRG
ncbi:hypothetical protein [Celeribacter sp.]|uniref:phosphorylase family protein n=1 Tax=Celeribacter sp. TaxID=1890673 RepID=UPI003A95CF1F